MTRPSPLSLWLRAGLLTALIDGAFSGLLAQFVYGSSAARLFQGVAATLLGPSALEGGTRTLAIGVLMHVGVAFGWSAVFLLLALGWPRLQSWLRQDGGPIRIAGVFGPLVWVVMSLAVIPLLTQRPPSLTIRWLVQLVGHFPFVGVPIVTSIARGFRPAAATA